jgi:hypothetical protein
MNQQPDQFSDHFNGADAILAAEEPDAWTLDELDHSADLGSLRSAWASGNDTNF